MSRLMKLKKGDRVALICASGSMPSGKLEPALAAVRSFGLEPVAYESCRARHGYLAGSDALRAHDVQSAFEDPSIAGILCARGGYGAHRILPLLDLDSIRRHPKPLLGYSDVTALHIALNNMGMPSWHATMPATEWCGEDFDPFTRACTEDLLFAAQRTLKNPDGYKMQCLQSGTAEGILVGGNLSLVSASIGTPWELDCRDKILFLEDINEDIYRVDKMLTHLRNAGLFQSCAGVILGAWTNCKAKDPDKALTLTQVFEELLVPCGKPVLTGLRCGHCLPSLCLPLGEKIRMDADNGILDFPEE